MTRAYKFTFLFILLGLIFYVSPAVAFHYVLNIRHWAAPDHTRVVIDMSDDVPYTLEEADKKLIIHLKETLAEEEFPQALILKKPGIDKIMITCHPEGMSIELSLGENVITKVFKQKKFQDKPDRIVIDIEFPEVEKQESKERAAEKVLKKNKIIVIDPGHGGDDPGAVGKLKTQEKRVVLDISRKLRDIINSNEGYRAFLTRDGDYYVPFKKRLKIAREYGADLFVSVHADAFSRRDAKGSSVYCLSIRGASSEAAKLLARNENMADIIGGSPNGENSDESDPIILNMFQTNTINASRTFGGCVLKHLNRVNQVKFRTVQEAPFIVLKLPEIPSLLVETAYISNPKEEKMLRSASFQTEIAKAIAASVKEFLPVQPGQPATTPHIVLTKKDEDQGAVYKPDKTEKFKKLQTTDYMIKKGDTLDIIARRHNIKLDTLLKLNHMKLDDPLYFGRKLKIPVLEKEISDAKKEEEVKVSTAGEKYLSPASPPVTRVYMTKSGDTLDKIAKKNDTTVGVLLKLNKMKLEDPLYFGRKLKIPVLEKEISDEKRDEEVKVSVAGEISPPPASPSVKKVYIVKSGDTLDKIAKKNNTTIGVLLKLNKMKLQESLYVGRKLKLPYTEAKTAEVEKPVGKKSKANVYRVKKGDTLDKIAIRCNTSASELRRLNKIRHADLLYVDQKLRLPPS